MAVSYEKDVDGFHPLNVGTLAMQGRKPQFVSCTPKGCIELLKRCARPQQYCGHTCCLAFTGSPPTWRLLHPIFFR
jgi:5,10-methylene-tetrahydrofolate dehydrogenase/methenyl tetrahydrofolate cyclohydrolase